jgi:hypothetical protein
MNNKISKLEVLQAKKDENNAPAIQVNIFKYIHSLVIVVK